MNRYNNIFLECSGCGASYKETYGSYYNGVINKTHTDSTSETTELNFQFCEKCTLVVSEMLVKELIQLLSHKENVSKE